jgi:NTE family protein
MSYRLQRTFATVLILTLTGCATYPVNPPLSQYNPKSGYRYENLTGPANSESLFVILTFSGGGTRAAAFSYGVMERLRNTKIHWEGQERRLLDEVDVISSVSGGSFTAAYYGLLREELFDPAKFEKAFLYRNIQGELIAALFNPINWFRLASPGFGRIELAAELYDREIFRGKTFGDLVNQGRRPYIMINATDITMGAQFSFVQDQFDLICSDLAGVPVSRAVAASSNFPIAFTPLIVNNYAGTCNYKEPAWMEQALKDLLVNPPRFNRARIARSYLNSDERRYVHLLDGGVADNIGLRSQLMAIQSNDLSWSLLNKINLKEIKKLVVVVVDARTDPKFDIDKSRSSPGLGTLIDIISSVPMSNYSIPYSSCWTHSKVGAGRKLPTPRAKVFFETNVLPAKCGHHHLMWQTVLRFTSASTRLRMRKSGRISSTCPPLSLCRGKRWINSEESVRKFSTNRKSIKNSAQNLDARRNSVAFSAVLRMRIAMCARKLFRNLYFQRLHIGLL